MEIQVLAGFLAMVMIITYVTIHFPSGEVDANPNRRKMTYQKRYAAFEDEFEITHARLSHFVAQLGHIQMRYHSRITIDKEQTMFLKHLRITIISLILFTILTGMIYPLAVTGISQLIFPGKANGSLIRKEGKVLGSELIGQPFSDPKYFWSRLSATGPYAYNAGSSTGSNYGPLNPALFDAVRKRVQDLKAADSLNTKPIPVDLVTASGSGLDPHISIAAALYQASRVARNRGLTEEQVRSMIDQYTDGRTLGFLGEPGVNVLRLNLALDELKIVTKEK